MAKYLRYVFYILIGVFLGGLVGLSTHGLSATDLAWIGGLFNISIIESSSPELDIRSAAPSFVLFSTAGERVDLNEMTGKPVIINFWASWCGPCVIEMPLLQERYDAHQDDLLVFAVNSGESETAVSKFMQENELHFPALLDPTKNVVKRYNIRAYPTTYFIDGQGVIQAIHVGVLTNKLLDKYLRVIGVVDG